MKHYLITNRQIIDEYSANESIRIDGKEEAVQHLRFAYIADGTNLSDFDDPNDVITLYPHEEGDDPTIDTIGEDMKGSSAFFSDLYQDMISVNGGDVLLFIHGYNCDLKGAVETLHSLQNRYVVDGSPIKHLVMFTWPAQSSMLKYRDDIRDSITSGSALARGFMKLFTFYDHFFRIKADGSPENPICQRNIHIMAHSTGNRVLEHAMRWFTVEQPSQLLYQVIGQVLLMAADIDNLAMEKDQYLSYITRLARRVTVYNNKKDKALLWSQSAKNAYPRLGLTGVRDVNAVTGNVVMVDVSDTKEDIGSLGNKFIGHGYYCTSSKVVADIINVCKGTPARDLIAANARQPWPDKSNLYWIS